MSGNRAAVRYAKAILEVATSKSVAQEVNNDMTLIAKTIQDNAELATFIANPTLKIEVKNSALLEVFKEASAVTKSLFQLLLENKRFELLDKVATQYTKLYDEANGVEVATVTTAIAITPELEAKVLAKAGTLTTKKVTLKNIVNPAIIGGFILRIGDKQYNASVANSLLTLKRELSN
ncbi:ATP synthase F1 subunit delta [Flavobacterium sp.]|uniref:ATP synthase F1 subunit delta n=1 Tax=Flavobacterium sp. TaxID=239 RepID=UPI003D0E1028